MAIPSPLSSPGLSSSQPVYSPFPPQSVTWQTESLTLSPPEVFAKGMLNHPLLSPPVIPPQTLPVKPASGLENPNLSQLAQSVATLVSTALAQGLGGQTRVTTHIKIEQPLPPPVTL